MPRRSILVGALVVALLIPAAASARTIRHEGKVAGDGGSVVKLRVIKRGGEIEAVRGIRIRQIESECKDGGTDRLNLRLPGKIEVNGRNFFRERYKVGSSSKLTIRGRVKRQGRKVTARVRSGFFEHKGRQCRIPDLKLKTRA